MKNRKRLMVVATLSLCTIITSCREELLSTNETSESKAIIQDATVKNGRLYFPNKESLQFHYDKIKNESEEKIAEYVDNKDFISLRPVATETNESIISKKLNKRLNKLRERAKQNNKSASAKYLSTVTSDEEILDDIDDLEELIGDDAYGAFLNDQAEIQVGQEIYKYTDVGLFVVSEDKYTTLEPYLISKNISTDLLVPTEESARVNYVQMQPCNQLTDVYEDLRYFNALDCDSGGGYNPPTTGGGGSGGYNPPVVDPNVQMMNYINNLPLCNISHGLFGNLFGENDVCIDRYEDKYRVKTKAFNYNYLLVYHLGVKVKHQYKGWTGIWRKEDAQEIRLGVQGVQFQYDFSGSFLPQSINYGKTNIYTQNNRYNYDAATFWNQNSYGIYEMTGFSMQSFPKLIQDDIVLENFGRNTAADLVGLALAQGNRQLKSDNLNKMFWESSIKELKDFWIKIGKPAPATDNKITLFRKYPEFGKVLIHKTYYEHKYNNDVAEKTFDFGGDIKINFNPDNGQITNVSPGDVVKRPEDFLVKMYGIAKRNGQWHGSRIDNTR